MGTNNFVLLCFVGSRIVGLRRIDRYPTRYFGIGGNTTILALAAELKKDPIFLHFCSVVIAGGQFFIASTRVFPSRENRVKSDAF